MESKIEIDNGKFTSFVLELYGNNCINLTVEDIKKLDIMVFRSKFKEADKKRRKIQIDNMSCAIAQVFSEMKEPDNKGSYNKLAKHTVRAVRDFQ